MAKINFPKEPICEQCGQHSPVAFCYLGPENGWKFCCHCTDNDDWYYIMLDGFFNSPASTVDWLAPCTANTGWIGTTSWT